MDEATLLTQVTAGLQGVLSTDTTAPEKHLLMLQEQQAGVALVLLKIVQQPAQVLLQQLAVISFKNLVRKRWYVREGEPDLIGMADRVTIKAFIVDVMLSAPPVVRSQLSVAIAIIAEHDFPAQWPELLPVLLSKLDLTNPVNVNGILQTLHAIFKRYRYTFRSDTLMRELKLVLEHLQAPLLQLFNATDEQLTIHSENRVVVYVLYDNMFLLFKIFQSLSSTDLPEYFEDNLQAFTGFMRKYLMFSSQALLAETEGDEMRAGLLEKVRTAVVQICELYTQKYAEEFTMLGDFVQAVWNLLVATGADSKYDMLVSESIRFLSTVAKNKSHQAMFAETSTLKSICEKVVIPNMQFMQSDEELFEDNPMDFIRRDLEGSDFETRRRAACDFVRALTDMFPAEVTQIFSAYIGFLLQQFQADPTHNWRAKDTAIVLVIALAVRSSTASLGVTNTNQLVNLNDFFNSQVLPYLSTDINSDLPVLKADCIKFVYTFRNQIPKEGLALTLPLCVSHLKARNPVVATYAAITLERVLALKIGGDKPVFSVQELQPLLQPTFEGLFMIIFHDGMEPAKVAENDHAMKTIMRVVQVFREGLKPLLGVIVIELVKILGIVAKQPSNPRFNHNLFETIGSLVKYTAEPTPESVSNFEQLLFPSFQEILRADVGELSPYVFQILAQLLELRTGPNAVAGAYLELLGPLLSPYLWEQHGNVTPLVRLLRAYFFKGAQVIVAQNLLLPVLGVFQRLVASRMNDHEGFFLINAIIQTVPLEALSPHLSVIFTLLLQRLMNARTAKFTRSFVVLFFLFSAVVPDGANVLAQILNGIQPNLFQNLFENLVLQEVLKSSGFVERKICAVGLIKFVTTNQIVMNSPKTAGLCVTQFAVLLEKPDEDDQTAYDDDGDYIDVEGYQSVYSRLAASQKNEDDPLASIPDTTLHLAQSLTSFVQTNPGQLRTVLSGAPPNALATLSGCLARVRVDLTALINA